MFLLLLTVFGAWLFSWAGATQVVGNSVTTGMRWHEPTLVGVYDSQLVVVDQAAVYLQQLQADVKDEWLLVWTSRANNSIDIDVWHDRIAIYDPSQAQLVVLQGSNAVNSTSMELEPHEVMLCSNWKYVMIATVNQPTSTNHRLTVLQLSQGSFKVDSQVGVEHFESLGISAMLDISLSNNSDIVVVGDGLNGRQLLHFEYIYANWSLRSLVPVSVVEDRPILHWLSPTSIAVHQTSLAVASLDLTTMTFRTMVAEPLTRAWIIDSGALLLGISQTTRSTLAVYCASGGQWVHSTDIELLDAVKHVVSDSRMVYYQDGNRFVSISLASLMLSRPSSKTTTTHSPTTARPSTGTSHLDRAGFGLGMIMISIIVSLAYRRHVKRKYQRASLVSGPFASSGKVYGLQSSGSDPGCFDRLSAEKC
jgi:hypothetical protein